MKYSIYYYAIALQLIVSTSMTPMTSARLTTTTGLVGGGDDHHESSLQQMDAAAYHHDHDHDDESSRRKLEEAANPCVDAVAHDIYAIWSLFHAAKQSTEGFEKKMAEGTLFGGEGNGLTYKEVKKGAKEGKAVQMAKQLGKEQYKAFADITTNVELRSLARIACEKGAKIIDKYVCPLEKDYEECYED